MTKEIRKQRELNEQTKTHFLVKISICGQKGGCNDAVIKELIATINSVLTPLVTPMKANGFGQITGDGIKTLGERIRKLGVDHLLSVGAPTAFAPLVSIHGKFVVRPPVPNQTQALLRYCVPYPRSSC